MHNFENRFTEPVNLGNLRDQRNEDFERSDEDIVVEFVEYLPNEKLRSIILQKTTGNITATTLCVGEELLENSIPYDTFIQVIAGAAEMFIEDKKYILRVGNGIIIPAHASHCINANEQFKMISTVIRNLYP